METDNWGETDGIVDADTVGRTSTAALDTVDRTLVSSFTLSDVGDVVIFKTVRICNQGEGQ